MMMGLVCSQSEKAFTIIDEGKYLIIKERNCDERFYEPGGRTVFGAGFFGSAD
jgi:hypothetical protein